MEDIFHLTKENDLIGLEILLRAAADVNAQDGLGRTALHLAATYGLEDAAKLLIEFGADHSLQDYESGWTPLHRSLYFQNLGVSLLLIQNGAKIGDENNSGDWRAIVAPKREMRRSIRQYSSWKSPIDHDGYSPLDLLSLRLVPYLSRASKSMECTDITVFGKADFPLGIPLPNASEIVHPKRMDAMSSSRVVEVAASKFHSVAVTQSGEVYSWGHGRSGRLGHGDETTQPEPKLISFFNGKIVKQIAISENHSLCCTNQGVMYSWGSNRFGQLGTGHRESSTSTSSYCMTPRKIDTLKRHFVIGVAAGNTHSVCFSTNQIWSWGSNNQGQLGLRPAEVGSLEGGGTGVYVPHLVSLAGYNTNSSSGGSTSSNRLKQNLQPPFLQQEVNSNSQSILQVSASAFSTLALYRPASSQAHGTLPTTNEVYQWGHGRSAPSRVYFHERNTKRRNSSGNLEEPDVFGFRTGNTLVNITMIAAGRAHNIALSSAAHVYTWGLGSDQLGHGMQDNRLSAPQLLEALLPENGGGRVVYICAANNHSCVVTDTGDLYTWGTSDDKGVLGHGQGLYQPVPKRVVGIKRAIRVAGGDDHTLVLSAFSLPSLPYAELGGLEAAEEERSRSNSSSVTLDDSDEAEVTNDLEAAELFPSQSPVCVEEMPPLPYENEEAGHQQLSAESNDDLGRSRGTRNRMPTLKQICERRLASCADVKNVVVMSEYAEAYQAPELEKFCMTFIQRNLDAILVNRLRQINGKSYTDHLLSKLSPIEADKASANTSSKSNNSRSSKKTRHSISEDFQEGPFVDKDDWQKPKKLSFDFTEKRDRANSQDYETIEGVNRVIKSIKKKIQSITSLEMKRAEGRELTEEQLSKLERKSGLEAELHRVLPILSRLQMKQELLQRYHSTSDVLDTIQTHQKREDHLGDETQLSESQQRCLSKDSSMVPYSSPSPIEATSAVELVNGGGTATVSKASSSPPSFDDWMSSTIDVKPDASVPSTALQEDQMMKTEKRSKGKGKKSFKPLDEFLSDKPRPSLNVKDTVIAVQTSNCIATSTEKSSDSFIVRDTPKKPAWGKATSIPQQTAAEVASSPSSVTPSKVTPTASASFAKAPLAVQPKSTTTGSSKNTTSSLKHAMSSLKIAQPSVEPRSLADFIVPAIVVPSTTATKSTATESKKPSSCPWGTPLKDLSSRCTLPTASFSSGASSHTISPATLNTAASAISLYDIQNEEEELRRRSNMPSLAGHDNPWYVERRARTESFEEVVRKQAEEARRESEKRREEEDLRLALLAVEEDIRKSNNKSEGKGKKRDQNQNRRRAKKRELPVQTSPHSSMT